MDIFLKINLCMILKEIYIYVLQVERCIAQDMKYTRKVRRNYYTKYTKRNTGAGIANCENNVLIIRMVQEEYLGGKRKA